MQAEAWVPCPLYMCDIFRANRWDNTIHRTGFAASRATTQRAALACCTYHTLQIFPANGQDSTRSLKRDASLATVQKQVFSYGSENNDRS
jgi:hypothetical protein